MQGLSDGLYGGGCCEHKRKLHWYPAESAYEEYMETIVDSGNG